MNNMLLLFLYSSIHKLSIVKNNTQRFKSTSTSEPNPWSEEENRRKQSVHKKLSRIHVRCVKQVAIAEREKENLGLVRSVLDKREKPLLGIDDVVGGSGYPT